MTSDEKKMSSTSTGQLKATSNEAPKGFGAELKDAVSLRTLGLLLGVLLIQFAFIASYIGAFHDPKPHGIPVGVVAPAPVQQGIIDKLNALPDSPVKASAVTSEEAGKTDLKNEDLTGVYVVNPAGTQDTLLVASASGVAATQATQIVLEKAAASQGRTVQLEDIVESQHGDGRGLTSFYLVVGWIVGGYLFASMLGVAKGSKPVNVRRALIRIGAIVPYALLSGFGGAWLVDKQLGALTGHIWQLAWIGTLLVLCSSAVTMALQALFGVIGIGLTVLLFVVLGNPSAGGPYQSTLLPDFWRNIGGFLPNGAGVTAVRSLIYFDGVRVGNQVALIALWTVAGILVTLIVAAVRQKKGVKDVPTKS